VSKQKVMPLRRADRPALPTSLKCPAGLYDRIVELTKWEECTPDVVQDMLPDSVYDYISEMHGELSDAIRLPKECYVASCEMDEGDLVALVSWDEDGAGDEEIRVRVVRRDR
jgi:hypothetical protein